MQYELPVISSQKPIRISWSSLKRLENCPQHQYRHMRQETDISQKGRIFLPGTVCDLVQRRWLDSGDPQPGQMPDMVEAVLNETIEKRESVIHWNGDAKADYARVKAHCIGQVKRLEPWLLTNVVPFEYAAEHKFEVYTLVPFEDTGQYLPILLNGGIDIVVHDPAQPMDRGYRLHDLKISESPSYLRSTLAQLVFYNLVWGTLYNNYDAVDYHSFVTPSLPEMEIPLTLGHEDRRLMLSRIIKFASVIARGCFDPNPEAVGCSGCEAKRVCTRFNLADRLIRVEDADHIKEHNGRQRLKVSFTRPTSV